MSAVSVHKSGLGESIFLEYSVEGGSSPRKKRFIYTDPVALRFIPGQNVKSNKEAVLCQAQGECQRLPSFYILNLLF